MISSIACVEISFQGFGGYLAFHDIRDLATLFLCHLLSWILEQRKNKNLHEGGVLDLLVDILVLIERESAREGDVYDHTSAPHVQ